MAAEPYRSNNENLIDYLRLCMQILALYGEREPLEQLERVQELESQIRRREAESSPEARLTFPVLRQVFLLKDLEWFCLVLALCCEIDGGLRNAVQALTGSSIPTFDLACSLYGARKSAGGFERIFLLPDPELSPLRYALALEHSRTCEPFLMTPMIPRRNLLRFAVSGFVGEGRYYSVPAVPERFQPIHGQAFQALLQRTQDLPGTFLYVRGQAGSGKRSLVRRIAQGLRKPCLTLDCGVLSLLEVPDQKVLALELSADLVLSGGILCLSQYLPERCDPVCRLIAQLPDGIPVYLLSDSEDCPPPLPYGRTAFRSTLDVLSPEDFRLLLNSFQEEDGFRAEEFPAYYRLTAGQLLEAWKNASDPGKPVTRQGFARSVRRLNGAMSNAQAIESDTVLEDLVVAPETMEKLRMVCSFAEKSREVESLYRASGKSVYGNGVTALFYGQSGTGKTMAASAIANELGLELARIDLSRILDKYIGETEKHLAEVFASAKGRNCILFFDEADALFSKRTEISSSHDRYANVETSFLLQSIEEYDGIILLASNLFKNFDSAFLRRISVLVRFSLPDEELRLRIWRASFPEGAGIAEDVDLPLIARKLELTPAIIRASARTAVLLAAAERKDSVAFAHLFQALENELDKQGQAHRLAELRNWNAIG